MHFLLLLLAWVLPVIVITQIHKRPVKTPFVYSIASVSCTLTFLCGQMNNIRQQVSRGAFGTIEDTISGVLLICIAVSIVSVVLNLIALGLSWDSENEDRSSS